MTRAPGVWLVRHASTAWSGIRFCGRSDPPLDDAGRLIAAGVADRLAQEVPTGASVVSSPLRRARETAASIAAVLASDVRIDGSWAEVDMGAIDGLTWDEVVARWPAMSDALLRGAPVDWPDGERHVDFVERVGRAWERAAACARPIVIVSHGGPVRVVLAALGRQAGHVEPGEVIRVP